ncbi:hypothetical protein PVAG01_00542 [Phlyctema vagabunda]|uniref:Uncharacterized protein n=1 Tax=Phlyctema vagabunda TaxID=108571 RepID=A0ABR4PUJ0_9HELO
MNQSQDFPPAVAECSNSADDTFGPLVSSCRRSFDFTLLFEESFLSIVPSTFFILLAVLRLRSLYGKRKRVEAKPQLTIKLICIAVFAALHISLLVLWSLKYAQRTRTTIASATVSVVDVIFLTLLSHHEHSRSITPSTLLNVFLIFTVVFDVVRARTLWLMGGSLRDISAVFVASVAVKAIILGLEVSEKRRYLGREDKARGPEEIGGILNRSFFVWLNHLIALGHKKALVVDDLYPLDQDLSAVSLMSIFKGYWDNRDESKTHNYQLLWALCCSLKWQLLAPVPGRLALLAFTICQPLLLHTFINYLREPESPNRANVGYGMIVAYAVVYSGIALSTGFYWHRVYRSITMIRSVLVSSIYQKTLVISITALKNLQAVSLMSSDVQRIVDGIKNIHELWAILIQIGICTWLLYIQIGVGCVAPIVVSLTSTVLTAGLAAKAGKRQATWMEALEKRVGITASMLSSMKGVKISGLTSTLSSLTQQLRVNELKAGTSFRMVLVYALTLGFTPQLLSPVMAYGIFVAVGESSTKTLDSTRIFTAQSLILLITSPLSQLLQSIPQIVGAISCINRIQQFLLSGSRIDSRFLLQEIETEKFLTLETFDIASFPESLSSEEQKDVRPTLKTEKRQSTALAITDGSFGWNIDEPPIVQDLNLNIPASTLTMVVGPVACGKSTLLKAILGETPLSRGEVRISSKRIAFCDQSTWLNNSTVRENIIGYSPFNALWYDEVVYSCVLQKDFLEFPKGERTVIGSKGIALSGGQKQRVAIARAVYAKTAFAIFDDPFSGLDATTQQQLFSRVFGPQGLLKRQGVTVIISTHAANLLRSADHIVALGKDGRISEQGTFDQLEKNRGYLASLTYSDKNDVGVELSPDMDSSSGKDLLQEKEVESSSLGIRDLAVYAYYFRSIGRLNTVLFFALEAIFAFIFTFPSIWLTWWSQSNEQQPRQRTAYYLGGYAGFQGGGVLTIAILAWLICNAVIVSSGTKLHRVLLKAVMSAPMSFFATTDAGVIINRFSQDMLLIDTELPISLLDLVAGLLTAIGQAALIANSSYYIAISYPFVIAVFFAIQQFYLRISRQLRLLDLESKSPLYSLFIESLSGLATVRAFEWQTPSQALNEKLLDRSQRPFYLLYMIQRWLTLVLELLAAGLAVIIVGVAVALRNSTSPGFTGVALVNLIGLTESLKYLIITWTTLETALGAVSRVKDFAESTQAEDLEGEIQQAPENWPESGRIEFRQTSVSYGANEKRALNQLDFQIKAGERIAICGRSGSGKSSLVMALFHMIEIQEGSIVIDDVDIATLPRQTIRSRLNVIPQDPYFLQGSVRMNVDPFQKVSDTAAIGALSKVHLWSIFEDSGGLDAVFDEATLSHGQRQLFCLARSILRRSKIVVLDEATSSVDQETETLMQRIIQDEFRGCTTICVAHRLDAILDFDRVVVLDAGALVECDAPAALLARPSAFRTLYEAYSSKKSSPS